MFKKIQYIEKSAVIRLAFMVLALANQILTMAGKPILDVNNETFEVLVSAVFTAITGIVAWYYNNPTSAENKNATRLMREEKQLNKDLEKK